MSDDISTLRRILRDCRTIAVVGLSAEWHRPSYFAAKYMQQHGYRVVPVNPRYDEVLGERCYPSLDAIPFPVDMVDVFRKTEDVGPIAACAIAIGAKVVWMQLGVHNDEAAKLAEDAGLKVVMNRCPKMEYGKLSGEWAWVGGDSGIISSKKQAMHESGKMQSLGLGPRKGY